MHECMSLCMFTSFITCAHKGHKSIFDPLKMKLVMAVSLQMCDGNQAIFLFKSRVCS